MAKKKGPIEGFKPLNMPENEHRKWGSWENEIWLPADELYQIPNAFAMSFPSKHYPYGFIRHFYSKKFSKLLAYYRPDIYCKIHKIDKRFKHYKLMMAWRFKEKVKRGGK